MQQNDNIASFAIEGILVVDYKLFITEFSIISILFF